MLPTHLRRYIVEQDYSRYTPVDQAVWRYIMHQLTEYLSQYAHPCYLEGLQKTGISVDRIPEISQMSEQLGRFGWHAVPVSGFIPPAAFMELQAHGYLPIASDVRTVDHLMYTPAPDIVHEAAGHAPILIDPEFAAYLKAYAQVASRAIISREDMDQYEAIRVLSDLKENPNSTAAEVRVAEERLAQVTASISHLSEAALLGRMNWWTAEYGLIGTLENPKIYGAGLLSSVGEARECLGPKVRKIPLTLDCINFGYDITEPQPQLFVTPSFHHLHEVLEQFADQMAFRQAGVASLEKACKSETVNTVELNSGLQISGRLKSTNEVYLQFEGPSQLCVEQKELSGHGCDYHSSGFGSPIGAVDFEKSKRDAVFGDKTRGCLSEFSDADLTEAGLVVGELADLHFHSGVRVSGKILSFTRHPQTGRLILISWENCTALLKSKILFDPAWGTFDMAVGLSITSVFGGPADRLAYGETDDFAANVIPRKIWPADVLRQHRLYQQVRDTREGLRDASLTPDSRLTMQITSLIDEVETNLPDDWLIRLELLELARGDWAKDWAPRVDSQLKKLAARTPEFKARIDDGLRVIRAGST